MAASLSTQVCLLSSSCVRQSLSQGGSSFTKIFPPYFWTHSWTTFLAASAVRRGCGMGLEPRGRQRRDVCYSQAGLAPGRPVVLSSLSLLSLLGGAYHGEAQGGWRWLVPEFLEVGGQTSADQEHSPQKLREQVSFFHVRAVMPVRSVPVLEDALTKLSFVCPCQGALCRQMVSDGGASTRAESLSCCSCQLPLVAPGLAPLVSLPVVSPLPPAPGWPSSSPAPQ